jgi:hypothetical protein
MYTIGYWTTVCCTNTQSTGFLAGRLNLEGFETNDFWGCISEYLGGSRMKP